MMVVYAAPWVLPIAAPPIADGAVAVDAGRIVWVGERRLAPAGAGVEHVELGDAVLLPGLVNTHTHLELTVMRGFLEELGFREWIHLLTAARRDVFTDALAFASARAGIAEGVLAGITTFADTCASDQVARAMEEAGVRGIVYQEVFGPDPAQSADALRGLQDRVERLRAGESDRVRIGVSPHAPYSVSDPLLAATADYARVEALPIAVHIAESRDEYALVTAGTGEFAYALRGRGIAVEPRGTSPVELLERTGVLAAAPLLIHCVQVSQDDVERMATHDCAVAHCPASNAKLRHGIAPLGAFLAAGVRVGLGSDSVASNNRMDLLEEGRLASLLQRAHDADDPVLDAPRILRLATLDGARALGLDREIGSLEVGKQGDLTAFSLGGMTPVYTPEDALVWGGNRRCVLTVVAGRVLVRDGALTGPAPSPDDEVRDGAARLAEWRRRARTV